MPNHSETHVRGRGPDPSAGMSPWTEWLYHGSTDALSAIKLSLASSGHNLLISWIVVPFGVMVMLASCFGVHLGLAAAGVSFPASVACMILLFVSLLLSEWLLGSNRTRIVVNLIDVPAGWALRWINLFFTPSFILLPLSPSIGGIEVAKIIAVFLIGFFAMMVVAAYLTRGLQLLFGSSKRAVTARAEEMGDESDDIPLAQTSNGTEPPSAATSRPISFVNSSHSVTALSAPPPSQTAYHHHSATVGQADSRPPTPPEPTESSVLPPQAPIPSPRSHVWASRLTQYQDQTVFGILFVTVGLPVYYATGYPMPAHLTLTILCYFVASSIPIHLRQYLHPVLITALASVLIIWALAAIQGDALFTALRSFRTGANYRQLWMPPSLSPDPQDGNEATTPSRPGAGDIFATALDASIVALALPMYHHRRELKSHFPAIVVPSISLAAGSLVAYPAICHAIGIGAKRALAFASRSLTLALAMPATTNLGGDADAVAALAIMSGILGVLVGERMLKMMRIPEDDYVTRGVTLGANSSAIATAVLLRTDPRAAALSSLSMSLFGTITVLMTAIPPVATFVRSLVGL